MIGVKFDGQQQMRDYQNAFKLLRAMPGYDHKLTLRAEAGSILKQWAGRTKVSTAENTDRRSRKALLKKYRLTGGDDGRDVSINVGMRGAVPGRVWFYTKNKKYSLAGVVPPDGGSPRWMHRHFKNKDWTKIIWGGLKFIDNIGRYIKRGRGAQSLARQSVVQIADALKINLVGVAGQGISPAGIAKARAAIASTGKVHRNGFGYEGGNQIHAYVDLINRLPYGIKTGMDRTLAWVLAGRAKYIETAHAKGAFDCQTRAARAFPNIIRVRWQAAHQKT